MHVVCLTALYIFIAEGASFGGWVYENLVCCIDGITKGVKKVRININISMTKLLTSIDEPQLNILFLPLFA